MKIKIQLVTIFNIHHNVQWLLEPRMSMFFFRLHNLQRAEESKRKKRAERQRQQQRQRRGAKVFHSRNESTGYLTLAPSRLFEKTPMNPSDSLDEIALQIPRYVLNFVRT